jgi:hypothetical protein
MKAFSLVISLLVFAASGYYFITDFNLAGGTNHVIYMSLLVVLMLVCIVGFLINIPLIVRERRRMKVLMYKQLSRKTRRAKAHGWRLETT